MSFDSLNESMLGLDQEECLELDKTEELGIDKNIDEAKGFSYGGKDVESRLDEANQLGHHVSSKSSWMEGNAFGSALDRLGPMPDDAKHAEIYAQNEPKDISIPEIEIDEGKGFIQKTGDALRNTRLGKAAIGLAASIGVVAILSKPASAQEQVGGDINIYGVEDSRGASIGGADLCERDYVGTNQFGVDMYGACKDAGSDLSAFEEGIKTLSDGSSVDKAIESPSVNSSGGGISKIGNKYYK